MHERSVGHHPHDQHCDCAAHRPRSSSGLWCAVLPLLACAVCPVCLANYAKLLSIAGMGFGLSHAHHFILLVVALSVSLVVSGLRSWRTKRIWPIAVAVSGAGLVLAGHLLGEVSWLEWAGVATLFIGGLTEQFRMRKQAKMLARA